jgi:hypothetical protein
MAAVAAQVNAASAQYIEDVVLAGREGQCVKDQVVGRQCQALPVVSSIDRLVKLQSVPTVAD